MKFNTFCLMAICGALAACNSEPAENEVVPTEAADAALVPPMPSPVAMEPAPEGLPSRIAKESIAAGGHACSEVSRADREDDGTITASCSSGETYKVYTAPGQGTVATPM